MRSPTIGWLNWRPGWWLTYCSLLMTTFANEEQASNWLPVPCQRTVKTRLPSSARSRRTVAKQKGCRKRLRVVSCTLKWKRATSDRSQCRENSQNSELKTQPWSKTSRPKESRRSISLISSANSNCLFRKNSHICKRKTMTWKESKPSNRQERTQVLIKPLNRRVLTRIRRGLRVWKEKRKARDARTWRTTIATLV